MATSTRYSKLTLRLDRGVIDRAKRYAHERGTSLSQMVSNYFEALTLADVDSPDTREDTYEHLGPVTRALAGLLRGSELDEVDYHHHLERRHNRSHQADDST